MALHIIIKNEHSLTHSHNLLTSQTSGEGTLNLYLSALNTENAEAAGEGHAEVAAAHAKESSNPFFSIDPGIGIWLWIVFALTLTLLYKFAWKPILTALNLREERIATAITNAQEIERNLQEAQENSKKIFQEAHEKSALLLEAARERSEKISEGATGKAREEAESILKKARETIENERLSAINTLRSEASRLSISIASKLIEENLSDEKNRQLSEKFLRETK